MVYLVIFLFSMQGQPASLYLGEVDTVPACYQTAERSLPKLLPNVSGIVLCVPKGPSV